VINNILERVKPQIPICVRRDYTVQLDAAIHPVAVLKAPVTANIPLLRKVARPILQESLPCLLKIKKEDAYLVFFVRVCDFDIFILFESLLMAIRFLFF